MAAPVIAPSATLAVNERVQARRAAGQQVLHLGFGEAGLPVLPAAAPLLAEGPAPTRHPPIAGTPGGPAPAAGGFSRPGRPPPPTPAGPRPALLYNSTVARKAEG
nr:hypothetical protein [Thermoanaerobacterales bacterium]